jgi:fatty-acyl-CoA synthase
MFERGLPRNAANYVAADAVTFLERSALIYPHKVAVRHGRLTYTYGEFAARSRRLASATRTARRCARRYRGGDGAQRAGAAGSALRGAGARRRAQCAQRSARCATIAFCLQHGQARVLITDAEFAPVIKAALAFLDRPILVVDIDDPEGPAGERLGAVRYDDLLAEGDPEFAWPGAIDEWDALALLYTSGTTGDPKGVVYHHRGAYLNALGNALAFKLSPDSVYLWTLPMFHCSGWTYTWAVTAAGGTHVCLRRVDPAPIFAAIRDSRVHAPVRRADRAQPAHPRAGGSEGALRPRG